MGNITTHLPPAPQDLEFRELGTPRFSLLASKRQLSIVGICKVFIVLGLFGCFYHLNAQICFSLTQAHFL